MTKTNKIIYWISTLWLALGMFSTGIVQLIKSEDEILRVTQLGYPVYFLTLLGVWKILGTVAVVVPGFPRLKEWAYAGFFFAMTGAMFSHVAAGAAGEVFPALLLTTLTVVSWYFRPANRKLSAAAVSTI